MLLKKTRLLFLYSRDFQIFSLLLSFLTYAIFWQSGLSSSIIIIWLKIILSILGQFIHEKRKAKELFFYMNLGLGKRELLTFALILDLGLWLIGLILLINLSLGIIQ